MSEHDMFDADMFAAPHPALVSEDGGPDDPFWQTARGAQLMGELREVEVAQVQKRADELERQKAEQDAREAERLQAQATWQAKKTERDAAEEQKRADQAARWRLEMDELDAAREARRVADEAHRAALGKRDDDFHTHRVSLYIEIEGASIDGQVFKDDSCPEYWDLSEDEDTNRYVSAALMASSTAAIEPWVSHFHSLGLVRADLVSFTVDGEPVDGITSPQFFLVHRAEDVDLSAETLADLAPVKIDLPTPAGATLTLRVEADPINATMLHDAMRRGGHGVGQWGGEETPDMVPAPEESRDEWLERVSLPRLALGRLVERWAASGRNLVLFRCYGDWTERANGNQEIEWVVEGVLPRGEVITVAGASGAAKSSVVHSWLTALGGDQLDRPRHVLGKPITGRYFCALVAGEESDGFINYREKKHATAWGPASYFVLNDPDKSLADHIETLSALPVLDVVVIDTVGSFFTGDEKSSAATREFLAPLHKLSRLQNCLIILVHHMTKGGENVKSIAGMKPHVKGAGDFVSAVRLAIGVIKPIEDGLELIMGPIKHNLPPEDVWLPTGAGRRYLLNPITFTLDPIAERGDQSAAGGEALEVIFKAIADQNGQGRVLRRTGRHELFEQKLPQFSGVSRQEMRNGVASLIEAGRVTGGPDGLLAVRGEPPELEAA